MEESRLDCSFGSVFKGLGTFLGITLWWTGIWLALSEDLFPPTIVRHVIFLCCGLVLLAATQTFFANASIDPFVLFLRYYRQEEEIRAGVD